MCLCLCVCVRVVDGCHCGLIGIHLYVRLLLLTPFAFVGGGRVANARMSPAAGLYLVPVYLPLSFAVAESACPAHTVNNWLSC